MSDEKRNALKQEYFAAKNAGDNLLTWCLTKAHECGMTYGKFVRLLGI